MLLSVIVPCFNEEGNIDLFYEETVKALGDLMPETELIFVNDGSRDATLAKLRALCARARYRVRVVSFSRNFGKEAALLAGLRSSTGEFTSIIDADLQQRPSYIVEMLDFLKEHPEYDAVAAYQEERKEGFILSLFKKMFYNVIDSMTDVKIMQAASDFRVLRRPVVDAILSLPEKCRFSKGIFAWVGFETYYMPYKVEERASGTSKWNFWKLLTYAFDGIIAFSNKPLILSSVVGFFIFALSILYLIVIVVKTILWGDPVAGFPTLACLILMLSGIELLGIGILGQYLAKNYTESKERPVYIVKEELENDPHSGPGADDPDGLPE
ncbi:Glycosyltransferase involved in cell wall bisynthesis [Sarcina sp. DSM 11001]|uniref:glycosyltransferase family 2 protein n=1 Tax=Sarcina sp. DSM 11001 TaxID=1798184 RepID=UPI0008835C61|nr:glycosyltransferase family 2 protein [Sarcina sp. DSM 11001]SDL28679.1 Glycosyltransferase involved in cell wall bisynthesis [Sarcina sp. DSM 11001]